MYEPPYIVFIVGLIWTVLNGLQESIDVPVVWGVLCKINLTALSR